jgi:hypothetical protein
MMSPAFAGRPGFLRCGTKIDMEIAHGMFQARIKPQKEGQNSTHHPKGELHETP